MGTLGDRIRKLRESRDMTQTELSIVLGMKTYTTVSKWESNDNFPKGKDLKKLAEFFNVTSDYLLGLDNALSQPTTTLSLVTDTTAKLEEPRQLIVLETAKGQLKEQEQEQEQANDNVIQFPVKEEVDLYGIMTAGYGTLNDEKSQPIETISMPVDDIPRTYDIAFRVSGDSMYPSYKDGDIIFVRKQTEVDQGMIGCVEINGEAFIKRIYVEDDGDLRLVSFNTDRKEDGTPLYPDRYTSEDDEVYIIGKVVN